MLTEFERLVDCPVAGRAVVLGGATIESPGLGSVTAFSWCSQAKRCAGEHGSVLDIPDCALHRVEHTAAAARGAPPPAGGTSFPIRVVLPGELADLVPAFIENRRKEARELALALQSSDLERLEWLAQRMVGVGAMYGFDAITAQGRAIRKALAEKRWHELESAVSDYGSYLAGILVTYSGATRDPAPPDSPPLQRPLGAPPAPPPAQRQRRASRFPGLTAPPQPALAAR